MLVRRMVGRLFSLFMYIFWGAFIIDFWSYIFGLKARRYPRLLHNDDSVAGISKGMDLQDQYIENTRLDNEELSKRPLFKLMVNIVVAVSYFSVMIAWVFIFSSFFL